MDRRQLLGGIPLAMLAAQAGSRGALAQSGTPPQDRPRSIPELAAWAALRREEALEPGLPIVDPHHHLWDDERGVYLIEDFIADTNTGHNIAATVYLQYNAMYRADGPVAMKPVGEVEFASGQAAISASGRYGRIRVSEGIVAHANLMLGDDVKPVLESMVAMGNGRMRGIRHGAIWEKDRATMGRTAHMLLDPRYQRGMTHLAPLGLSFDSWIWHHQLPDLIEIMPRFPQLSVIMVHTGGVLSSADKAQRDEVFKSWRANLRKLAPFPNLTMKIGGLGMPRMGWDFHLRDVPPSSEELAAVWRPYVETCIETFGVDRCMFESNFPMDKQSCGYATLWNAFKRITAQYSAADKAKLYHDNAVRVYRLPQALLLS